MTSSSILTAVPRDRPKSATWSSPSGINKQGVSRYISCNFLAFSACRDSVNGVQSLKLDKEVTYNIAQFCSSNITN